MMVSPPFDSIFEIFTFEKRQLDNKIGKLDSSNFKSDLSGVFATNNIEIRSFQIIFIVYFVNKTNS